MTQPYSTNGPSADDQCLGVVLWKDAVLMRCLAHCNAGTPVLRCDIRTTLSVKLNPAQECRKVASEGSKILENSMFFRLLDPLTATALKVRFSTLQADVFRVIPAPSLSMPHMAVSPTMMSLTFASLSNATYRVQRNDSMGMGPVWVNVGPLLQGDDTGKEVLDPMDAAAPEHSVYRVLHYP